MHFQVYIPGGKRLAPDEQLRDVGAQNVAQNIQCREIPQGPDGHAGLLCGWTTNTGKTHLEFHPDRQDWVSACAVPDLWPAGRYWVGFEKSSPPTPEELLRKYPYKGAMIRLGDTREWLFPRAAALPMDMLRQDDGSTAYIPQQKFAQFQYESDRWREFFMDSHPGGTWVWEQLRDFCELGLAVNYRMLPEVADRLRLWQSGDAGSVERVRQEVLQGSLAMCVSDHPEARDG